MEKRSDYLVIGSGLAGLLFALKAARTGTVSVVTKRELRESATFYAQGGIASVLGKGDSFGAHIEDTVEAGAGLSNRDVVEFVVRDGPGRIRELMDLGVEFSSVENSGRGSGKTSGEGPNAAELDLGREGGHSKRRIVHAGDLTGREIEGALIRAIRADSNISVYENCMAVDLITQSKLVEGADVVWGAYVLDKDSGTIHTFLARSTVLASGGAGKVYLYTSNPDVATGDGIAMAYRSGARIANMEFMQFHPTCLYWPDARNFLISEALRGEGGTLKLRDGSPFTDIYHPMGDLAPRDIVARAIDFELKKSGDECVYLDISSRPADFIKERFPNIYDKCLEFGFDITAGPIPVVPAAHFICGGIQTGTRGKSSLEGLWAVGETACTGLHGANRLASNSLLECLVFANRAAEDARETLEGSRDDAIPDIPPWETRGAVISDEAVLISQNWDEIRRFMWNYVSMVRSNKRLERAARRIKLLQEEINQYYWDFTVTSDLLELRNIATVAELIIRSSMLRKESRGLHYNIDYPEKDDKRFKRDTVLTLGELHD